MRLRVLKLIDKLRTNDITALLVTSPANIYYLSDFKGLSGNERECFLLITQNQAHLFTYSTYFAPYKDKNPDFTAICLTDDAPLTFCLAKIISKQKIAALGFESHNLSVFEYKDLKAKLKITLLPTGGLVESFRMYKDDAEIKKIRKAADLTDRTFHYLKTQIEIGVSEKELAFKIEFFIRENGGDLAFTPIVAIDENSANPHHISTADKKAGIGSLILLDFGARIDNYCADLTRVFFYKEVDGEKRKIYQTVLEAQQKALHSLSTNGTGNHADSLARNYISQAGFPPYSHGLGHGVGIDIHEAPRLKKDGLDVLKTNMVVTVEPGIYLPGNCGVRIEDLVLLKETGIEIISGSPKLLKELIIL